MKNANWFNSSLIGATCGLSLLFFATSAKATNLVPVELELMLVIDGSNSIPQDNFNTELTAYKNVFTSQDFFKKIVNRLPRKKLAIGAIQFADGIRQDSSYGVPWTLIDSQDAAINFGKQFATLSKLGGFSNIGGAIFAGAAGCSQYNSLYNKRNVDCNVTGINENNFDGKHLIFDVSTDGYAAKSMPEPFEATLEALREYGIEGINAISVGNDPHEGGLKSFVYGNNPDGSEAFVQISGSLSNFEPSFFQKLCKETVGEGQCLTSTPTPADPESVPEPSSLLGLISLGILSLRSTLKSKVK